MLYLVRHGQTEFNAHKRWQGHVDSPLTARGIDQANSVATKLRELLGPQETRIVSSPLMRAQATASIIARGLRVRDGIELDPRLMEVRMGSWDGLTDAEIEDRSPGARKGMAAGEWFFHSPDGETYPDMLRRVNEALRDIKDHGSAVTVIVCDGVTGRIIRGLHAGLQKSTMLDLEAPQDAVFALGDSGCIDAISCVPSAP